VAKFRTRGISRRWPDWRALQCVQRVLDESLSGKSARALYLVARTKWGALMPWHRVVFSHVHPEAGDAARAALMTQFDAVRIKAGAPLDAEVFHRSDEGNHIYYFSPKASEIAHTLLSSLSSKHFSLAACDDKPDLSNFHKLPS
jgi:hypothetical protein